MTPLILLLALAADVKDDKGWLSLYDGESTFGWKIVGDSSIKEGVLHVGGDKPARAETTAHFRFGVTVIEARWRGGDKPPAVTYPSLAELGEKAPGIRSLHSRKDRWTAVTVTRRADRPGTVRVTPEGRVPGLKEEMMSTETGLAMRGPAGSGPLAFDVPAGTVLELRLARFLPDLDGTLFDGKTLAGWKVTKDAKREKSKFTVKDGELHVKDGPGDLATDRHLDDFILRLECRSNGKHLNSGIFFRAIPGEYQNGYEAQIQNDFTLSPPKKHLVDVFDPGTGKKTGTREVTSAARDFGTGAIYRRIPARKGVAKDGEWFTMTVMARGRHIATWVNGVQQVDWTDGRAAHDNPRSGYRAKAGAISIQGHDPTTDLSFRNLRYAELPRVKE